ncbi:MAG: hypothetical protein LJE75_00830 [Gammaproteobacteria bacterium]|jgi:hypothetical protein|nr:hypothetical protein [Gammaproteobacteria bacterium]
MNKNCRVKVLARFRPKIVDDLVPELLQVIDTEAVFTYAWQMDEDDPLPGEWVLKTEDQRFGGYWIPECDLAIIKECRHGDC